MSLGQLSVSEIMKHTEASGGRATLHDAALARELIDWRRRPAPARELFATNSRLGSRSLRRGLRTPHGDLPGLVQEVFLRFFARLPALRDPSALRPFLLSITLRVLKWELRRRQLRRLVGLDPV